jgi:hypothetical protein
MKYDVGDCWQVKPLTSNITVTCKGDLNIMHQMSVNFVPWLLTNEQKQWQLLATNTTVGPTFLTWLSWSLLIPSCFWEWNYSYEDVISRMSLKCRNSHWLSCMWFWNISPSMLFPGCPWNVGTVTDCPTYGSDISVPALAGVLDILH